jgi:tetratricopeptide (TPR) repeat protein
MLVSISDKDRKILWGRSGNRCALCRRILVAERTSADNDAVVGDEAHIAARSPGGPRYGECPPDLVDGYENLILLCKVDHKKVDDQSQHFTAARLRQVKAEHEAWVEHTLGVLPVPHRDVVGVAAQADPIDHAHLPAPEPSAETVVVPVAGTRMAAPELFVGRIQEAQAVLNGLAPGRQAPGGQSEEPGAVVVSAVAGMGGVGKTTLARHAASVAVERGWFPGGAVMVNLRGYDPSERRIRPGQVFAPLLHALGLPPAQIPATNGEQAAAYHRLLADLAAQGRRVLLVLDNASTADQVLDLLPGQAVHRAVVTTRDTLTLPSTRRVELDVLNRRESLALLRGAVRQHHPYDPRVDRDRAASEQLVQVCGRLPLAIEIAAALLTDDPDLTPSALADDLADTATRLAVLRHGSTAVAGVIELSWQHLQERDPDAARLLRLLTLDLGPDISTTAAAALADAPAPLVTAQLRTLRQAHLLHATNGRWRMHDLIRLHIHDAHAEDDDHHAALTRLLNYYLTTAEAADNYFQAPSKRSAPTVFTGRLDAVVWLDTHRATLIAAVALATNSARHEVAVDLAVLVCSYLLPARRRNRENDFLAVARNAHTAATALRDPLRQAKALNLLGIGLYLTGHPEEADPVLRQALALCQDMGNRNREGTAWNNIALCLHDMQRFDEAITAHQQAITLYQEDGDRDQEARASANLGRTLHKLGRFDEALTPYRRAVNVSQETGNRCREGYTWNNLAFVVIDAQRWDEAIDALRCAQAAHRDDDNRNGEAIAWHNLGTALRKAGRPQEAIDAYRRALTAYQDDSDRYGEATAWHNLGLLLDDEQNWDEAIEAHRHAYALYRDTGDRDSEAAAWYNLGRTLHRARRVKAAIAAYRRALAIEQETGNQTLESQTRNALSLALSDDNRGTAEEKALGSVS